MNPQQNQYYDIKPEYAGKSLDEIGNQLAQQGSGIGRPDILANFLGIAPNQALQKDFSTPYSVLPENYRNSSEGQGFMRIFQPGMSPEQKAIQPGLKSLEETLPEISQKYSTERSRLEGEKEPLKQRYQTLLNELKNKESQQVNTAQIAAAREFGKRGVPLSSGAYDQFLAQTVNPIQQNYSTLQTQTNQSMEEGLRNLTNLITGLTPQETADQRAIKQAMANLQVGAGQSSIENAFRQLQFQEQQRQFNQQQSLAQEQFNFSRQQTEAQKKAEDLSKNFVSLSEGNTLFNLLTGQAAYTAPKTYKPTSGSGTGNLPDLNAIFG